MTEIFLKFPLFYHVDEEIQSRKIQNNIYIWNFPTPFSAGFPRSRDKRVEISKKNSVILYPTQKAALNIPDGQNLY